MRNILSALFLLSFLNSLAQDTQMALDTQKEERIYASRLSRFIPNEELFSSPNFEKGYIVFLSGKHSDVLSWNYNRLMHHMTYLAGRDTFFLKHDNQIHSIVTDRDQFYYYPKWGYIQMLVGDEDEVKLGVQRNLKILRRTRLTPTENPPLIVTPESFSTIYHPESYLLPREHVLLSKKTLLFLIDKTGHVYLANRSGFIKVFPEKEKEIDQLIRQRFAARNRINFTNEGDVQELFTFCTNR